MKIINKTIIKKRKLTIKKKEKRRLCNKKYQTKILLKKSPEKKTR